MLKGLFSQSGIFSKILILLGISCFTLIAGAIVMRFVPHANVQDVSYLKIMQLVESLALFVIPPFVFAYFCSESTVTFLHFNQRTNRTHILQVVLFMLLIIPGINLLSSMNQQLVLPKAFAGIEGWMKASEAQMAKVTEQMLHVHTLPALLFNIFLIAMIPAFGEELFFRGAVLGILGEKMNFRIAIWISAVVFSAIHLQFYGFLPRMLMGAFFGYLLFWSENLWLPIAAHFTNNAIAVIYYYLKFNGHTLPDIDTVGTGNTLWLGLLSIAFAVFGFLWLKKLMYRQSEIQSQR
jgi:membrane protease YdiL (CAAX protease family)